MRAAGIRSDPQVLRKDPQKSAARFRAALFIEPISYSQGVEKKLLCRPPQGLLVGSSIRMLSCALAESPSPSMSLKSKVSVTSPVGITAGAV